jgi:hypothetical protein
MSVQDGRKHLVFIRLDERSDLRRCPPDEVLPTDTRMCAPNPLLRDGNLLYTHGNTLRFYMRGGKKLLITTYSWRYYGWSERYFTEIDNFDLYKVIESGPLFEFKETSTLPEDAMVQCPQSLEAGNHGQYYYLVRNGTRRRVSASMYATLPQRLRIGALMLSSCGPGSSFASMPRGPPLVVNDLYPDFPVLADATLLQCSSQIYYVLNMTRRPISDDLFQRLKLDSSNVRKWSCPELSKLPEDGPLLLTDLLPGIPSGTLLQCLNSAQTQAMDPKLLIDSTYYVVDMTRYSLSREVVFLTGLALVPVRYIDCGQLEMLPLMGQLKPEHVLATLPK